MLSLPVDRERLVDLDTLASFHASSTKNALLRVVAVKGIRMVLHIRLRSERPLLMLDVKILGGVMNRAVSIVVVAYRAIEIVVLEDAIVGLTLRDVGPIAGSCNLHAGRNLRPAGPHQPAIDFDHAGIAGFDRTHLRVVTD